MTATELRLWNELAMFLGEGEMAILLHFGLVMLPFGYHLYLGGNRIPDWTVL